MTQFDNTNSGVLFKNDRKDSEKQPDYTGKINVAGKELQLAAWLRDGKKGKFMSLKVSEFQQKSEARTSYDEPVRQMRDVMDDEIPF